MKTRVEFYEQLDNGAIQCRVCPHNCVLREGKSGVCGVRTVEDGMLVAINYGEISALSMDPIEKKPLFHYKPGTNIFSVGSFGCNFTCGFCQNYSIAQFKPQTQYISPEDIVKRAKTYKSEGNIGIAFTYNEPMMYYEYVLDTAKLCKEEGLDVVVVTNGFINTEPLSKLLPYVDAMNIDLKSFSEKFYKKECSGNLSDILETIKLASRHCHVELTTLLITDHNDSEEEVRKIGEFIAGVDKNIPLHLSRYYPTYKFKEEATDIDKVKFLASVAREYLNYVYVGNILDTDNNTYCPSCKKVLIERNIYNTVDKNKSNKCKSCGEELSIVVEDK